jgi:predicted ATPase
MHIERIRLKNFKMFKDVILTDIPRFCIVVGANGTGKSTLFDVFGFLKDCLIHNVRKAVQQRGGFREIISRNVHGEQLEIELQFRLEINGVQRLVTYVLKINEEKGIPFVSQEGMRYKRGRYGQPSWAFSFYRGQGQAVVNEEEFNDETKELRRENQSLDSDAILAVKGLGQFQKFRAASAFRQIIENWHVSDFHINLARGAKDATGVDDHLSVTGDNLQLVARNLYENHRDIFDRICAIMRRRVPGITSVEPRLLEETGQILLRFGDSAFQEPFIDRYVSDGTMRMFAYLVMLHDPSPHPLLCVEEPENQLYVSLLEELAEEFRAYAERGGQVFVSTHSPDFLNAAQIDEVFWLVKQGGYTQAHRAIQDEQLRTYVAEGDQLGYLWKQGFFQGVDDPHRLPRTGKLVSRRPGSRPKGSWAAEPFSPPEKNSLSKSGHD